MPDFGVTSNPAAAAPNFAYRKGRTEMSDTRIEIETDRRGLLTDEFCSMTPSEMRRIVGGRCLYGTEANGCDPGTPLRPTSPAGELVWDIEANVSK